MSKAIGSLRHYLTLEEVTRSDDGGGGALESWNEIASFWAAIHPRSGSEPFKHHAFQGRISHEITIRYRKNIRPAMRFREGDRIFEIFAIVNRDERNRWLNCLCEERYL